MASEAPYTALSGLFGAIDDHLELVLADV